MARDLPCPCMCRRTNAARILLVSKTADSPLGGMKKCSTTIALDINDLPTTSPHGSYSEHDARNLGFASDLDATRGTVTAQRPLRTGCSSAATRRTLLPLNAPSP